MWVIHQLPLLYVLTENRTSHLPVYGKMLQPTKPHWPGPLVFLERNLIFFFFPSSYGLTLACLGCWKLKVDTKWYWVYGTVIICHSSYCMKRKRVTTLHFIERVYRDIAKTYLHFLSWLRFSWYPGPVSNPSNFIFASIDIDIQESYLSTFFFNWILEEDTSFSCYPLLSSYVLNLHVDQLKCRF